MPESCNKVQIKVVVDVVVVVVVIFRKLGKSYCSYVDKLAVKQITSVFSLI